MKYIDKEQCTINRRALADAQQVISGKWKLVILITLQHKPYRFRELASEIKITPRMLSKELQDLELNKLIVRTVIVSKPVSVEYSITEYGLSLNKIIRELVNWGHTHREKILKGKNNSPFN